MPRTTYDHDSFLRSLTINELKRRIADCAAKEEQRGMPSKARRT